MSEQSPSQIMYAIQLNAGLRNRVEALVRSKWWNDPEANPIRSVPVGPIAWATATNPTILASVTDAIVDGDIATAVDAIKESDLEYVVVQALARIEEMVPDVPEEPEIPDPEIPDPLQG